jgi:hypothetical protein
MAANSYQLHGIPQRIFGHVAIKGSCPDVAMPHQLFNRAHSYALGI